MRDPTESTSAYRSSRWRTNSSFSVPDLSLAEQVVVRTAGRRIGFCRHTERDRLSRICRHRQVLGMKHGRQEIEELPAFLPVAGMEMNRMRPVPSRAESTKYRGRLLLPARLAFSRRACPPGVLRRPTESNQDFHDPQVVMDPGDVRSARGPCRGPVQSWRR